MNRLELQQELEEAAFKLVRYQEVQHLNRTFLEAHRQGKYIVNEVGYEIHGFVMEDLEILVVCQSDAYNVIVNRVSGQEKTHCVDIFVVYGQSLLSTRIKGLVNHWANK